MRKLSLFLSISTLIIILATIGGLIFSHGDVVSARQQIPAIPQSISISDTFGEFKDENGILVKQQIELPTDSSLIALKNWAEKPYKALKDDEWEAKIEYRDINHMELSKIDVALENYRNKVPKLVDIYNSSVDAEQRQAIADKLLRIRDKASACFKEKDLRAGGVVRNELHHTEYYIDLDGGDDGNDGLSTGNAWLTIEKYTTTTVRTAGDIAWVRANTSEIVGAADIVFDEDGTANSYIEIRGCSVADDPWGDASNVKPIIDFNNGAFQMTGNGDDYWRLYRLDITNSADTAGILYFYAAYQWLIDACDIHLCTGATGHGIYFLYALGSVLNCNIYSNKTNNIYYYTSSGVVKGCILYGGASTTDYGLNCSGSAVDVYDTTFGVGTAHDTQNVLASSVYGMPGQVALRNCLYSNATEASLSTSSGNKYGFTRSEDHDQVKGDHKSWYWNGTVERSAATQLDGLDSILLSPNSNCGSQQPLTASGQPSLQGDYAIWCAAALTTVTITARETAAWAADPSNTEFYIEASYYSGGAGTGTRSTVVSNDSLNGTNEVDFDVSFTPTQAGWVYITIFLKDYEVGKTINVSIKPAVS